MSQTAAAAQLGQSIVNPDGSTNRIWLSSYVKGVAHDIDVNKYQSLTQYFDEDRKSTRLNSSHIQKSRMPSSA